MIPVVQPSSESGSNSDSLPDHMQIEAPSWQRVWNQVDMMDDEELLELVELETREMSWTQFEWDMRLQLYTHAATRSFVSVYDVTGIVQGWASMASPVMTPHSSKEHGTSTQKAIKKALRCSPDPSKCIMRIQLLHYPIQL